jgi:hypothetical protein
MWFHISDLTFRDPCWTFFLKSKDTQYLNSKLFPVVVALRAWSKFIMGKLVSYYLDNDAARSTFIRASASTSLSTTLFADYVDLNTNVFLLSVCRVASRSNPADQPFRLDFLRSVYVMQKGLNLSCQRTCRSGESTGALTLEKHDSLSRSSNMDRQHEPIRHHSFEAGIKASISKLPRQCKSGR